MSERRIPEHLYPAFCLFVLTVKHGVTTRRGMGEQVIAQAARHISVISDDTNMDDAHSVAMDAAGGNLTSTGWVGWIDWRR